MTLLISTADEPLTQEFCEELMSESQKFPLRTETQALKAMNECQKLFDQAVNEKLTIAVCGSRGSGKSAFINRLALPHSVGSYWGSLPLPSGTTTESITIAPIKLIHSHEPFARMLYDDGESTILQFLPSTSNMNKEVHVLMQMNAFIRDQSAVVEELFSRTQRKAKASNNQSTNRSDLSMNRHIQCFELGFAWNFNQHVTLIDLPGYEDRYLNQMKTVLSRVDGVILISNRKADVHDLKIAFDYGAFNQTDKTPWLLNVFRGESIGLNSNTSSSTSNHDTISHAMTDFYHDIKVLPMFSQSVYRSEFFASLISNAKSVSIPFDSPLEGTDMDQFYNLSESHMTSCMNQFVARIMNGVWMNFVRHISILMFFVRRELGSNKSDSCVSIEFYGQSFNEESQPTSEDMHQLSVSVQKEMIQNFQTELFVINSFMKKLLHESPDSDEKEAIRGLLSLKHASEDDLYERKLSQYLLHAVSKIERCFVTSYLKSISKQLSPSMGENQDLSSLFFDQNLEEQTTSLRQSVQSGLHLQIGTILSNGFDQALLHLQNLVQSWIDQFSTIAVTCAKRVIESICTVDDTKRIDESLIKYSELCEFIQAKANASLEHQHYIAEKRLKAIGNDLINNKSVVDLNGDSQYRGKTAVHGLETRLMMPPIEMIQTINKITKGRHDYDEKSLQSFSKQDIWTSKIETHIKDTINQPFHLITVNQCPSVAQSSNENVKPFTITLSKSVNERIINYRTQLQHCFARGMPRTEKQYLIPCSTIFQSFNQKIFQTNALIDYMFDSLQFLHFLFLTPSQYQWAQQIKDKINGLDLSSTTKDVTQTGGKVIVLLPSDQLSAAEVLDLGKEIMHHYHFDLSVFCTPIVLSYHLPHYSQVFIMYLVIGVFMSIYVLVNFRLSLLVLEYVPSLVR